MNTISYPIKAGLSFKRVDINLDEAQKILDEMYKIEIRYMRDAGDRPEAFLLGPMEYLKFEMAVRHMANNWGIVSVDKFRDIPVLKMSMPGIDIALTKVGHQRRLSEIAASGDK